MFVGAHFAKLIGNVEADEIRRTRGLTEKLKAFKPHRQEYIIKDAIVSAAAICSSSLRSSQG